MRLWKTSLWPFLILSAFLFADETPVLQRVSKTFDPSIPTIQSVLGYDFGEQITNYSDTERYLHALSKSSPRMKLQNIGKSYEGRSLYYVLVSSPENIERLEELRLANLRLADPRKITEEEADAVIRNNPVFVNLSYSVHGDEHSSTEAAMALTYYLLASTDAETLGLLKNCVMIIDPLQNPDGRERFVHYFYTAVGTKPSSDLNAAEHSQAWPGGRYNHYLFDMNRDWTILSQVETQARVKAYRQYQPEIFIDVHEMGENSTYFFPPPTTPRNPNLPKSVLQWWEILGKAIAADFDRRQIEYYTSERFDFWYPGYGDSWPTYNGALSGTFEQASVRGLIVKRDDGVIVHYKDAVWHHFLSSLATCKMASEKRMEKLRDFYQFRASAIQEGETGPIREFIISRSTDPLQSDRVIEKLLLHGIEIKQAEADFKSTVRGYYNDRTETRNFQKDDYIIRMDQPLKRLIQTTFEKETPLDKEFLDAEAQRRADKEPTEFYDIAAWSLPPALGLEGYWSSQFSSVQAVDVTKVLERVPAILPAGYAYLIDYNTNQTVSAVTKLLERNVHVYFSVKPFTLDHRKYHAGSFIIKTKDNPQDLHQILTDVAKQTGVTVYPTNTAWTEEGPDLGSNDINSLKRPRTAILTDMPVAATSVGAIRYILEQRYDFQYTPLQTFRLNDVNLNDYDVVVMPDSDHGWGNYEQFVGAGGIETLRNWIQNGGTLIAISGAAAFLAENGELTKVKRIKEFLKDSTEPAPRKKEDEEEEEKDQEKEYEKPDLVPGSIARARLNLKHFLTFGYSSEEIATFIYSSNVFQADEKLKPVATYVEADRLKMAGLFWDITKKRLEKKPYVTEEPMGEGHVILFAEDPNFRAYWEGLNRLFMNGILFGPSL